MWSLINKKCETKVIYQYYLYRLQIKCSKNDDKPIMITITYF